MEKEQLPLSQNTETTPRFATCSIESCTAANVRGRSCALCEKHLCAVHIQPRHHGCATEANLDEEAWEVGIQRDTDALLARVNILELTRIASSLRNGISCVFKPGKPLGNGAMMGAANYHCWISFEDGINWLVRVPKVGAFSDDPIDLVDYLVKSEYATLKFLEHLSLPTPKVYGYGLASDPNNLVGVAYLLEDAMPGKTFCVQGATNEQKTLVFDQYANFLIELSDHQRSEACSLILQNGVLKDSAIASNRFGTLGEYGPFDSAADYFKSIAELHLDLIADGQLYPDYPKEAFVFYRLLAEVVAPELGKVESPNGFFLKHVDDKGDHFLVDDDYNITAVIDWQFARFVPAVEAFGPSLLTADLHGLYSDRTGLSADDKYISTALKRKGREDLAKLAAGNELVRRFHFGLSSGATLDEVRGMIRAVLDLVGNDEMDVQDWVENEWNRDNGDPRLEKVKKLVATLALE